MVFLNIIIQGNPFSQEGRDALFKLVDVEQKGALDSDDIARISDELRFNLTKQEIEEVIHNVGGFEADEITADKFEKYLNRKIQKK